MYEVNTLLCYFDGSCRPNNPGGWMGYGFVVITDGGHILIEHSSFTKPDITNSNNVAEHRAHRMLVDWLWFSGYQFKEIHVFGDSKLVIEQMSERWRINQGHYVEEAKMGLDRVKQMSDMTHHWIPRDENKYADMLSDLELDKIGIGRFKKPSKK